MKNNINYIILFLFASVPSLIAQTIKGRVVDNKTNKAIVGANVQELSGSRGTTTDKNGEFIIETTSSILISYIGYETQTINPSAKYLRIRLKQSATQLTEIVVNAYQADRDLLTVAAPISVISKTDLQRADNSTIIPIFNAVPGVKLDHYTVGDYRLNIRGGSLAQPSVHGSGYRMYWNGIPITTASGGNSLGSLDINFIDNIEIIKGPGSSLYGAGFGGTVLVNTDKADEIGTQLSTDLMVGDYNTFRSTTSLKYNGSGGNIALRYTKSSTDGYRDMTDSEGDVLNLYGQIYTGQKGEVNFFYNYENRLVNIAGDLDEDTFNNAPQTANTIEPTGFGPDKHTIGLGYSYKFDNQWEASLGGYYFDNDGEFILSFPFFGIFDKEPSSGYNTRGTVTHKNKFDNINLKVDGGFEYGYVDNKVISYDSDFNVEGASITTINQSKSNQFMGFVQAELAIDKSLFFTAGLSFNEFRYNIKNNINQPDLLLFKQTVNQLASRFSILKKIGTYSFHASASQGFSPPAAGVSSDFLNPDGSVNNLQASTGWNFEIGSRGSSKNGLFFYNITAYDLLIQDAIIRRLFEISPGVNAERKTNAGEVKQRGVEAIVGLNLTTNRDDFWYGSQLRVGYTYNDYEYKDYQTVTSGVPVDYSGQVVPGTIPHSWLIMADIKTQAGIYLNFTFNHYDKTFLTDENDLTHPSYSIMNFRLGYERELLNKQIKIHPYLGVNNLGNTLYSSLNAYNSPFGGFFNPGFRRQFFAGVSLNYQL